MKQKIIDTIVIGLGAMGSAAVFQLAKRGHTVMGFDQFSPPHDYGSSHGETRIIRQAIGEGEEYIPLALRSYELWRELERESGHELLVITGGLILENQRSNALMHGRRGFLARTSQSAKRFGIRHEMLDSRDVRTRFPQFAVTDEIGYFEHETGYLRPESCIRAQLDLGKKHGAILRTDEQVLSVNPRQSRTGVVVKTSRADYQADTLVIAAGSWLSRFLEPSYADRFKVYRQVMFWFKMQDGMRDAMLPGRFPIFIWILDGDADNVFYGFPSLDGKTIKIASEQFVETTTPEKVRREVTKEEKEFMYRRFLADRLPCVTNDCERAAGCLYTMTPDSDFVIDRHPAHPQIIIASPCSGHGFKHSAAIGEVVADLIIEGKSKIDIGSFGIKRFNE